MEPKEKVHPLSTDTYFGVNFNGTQYIAQVFRNGKTVKPGSYASDVSGVIDTGEGMKPVFSVTLFFVNLFYVNRSLIIADLCFL